MYEEYYGFTHPPFSLTPDPRFLYRSDSHASALDQVWQAIRRKEGFIVLAGDAGTGKTTLCRTILEQFDSRTITALLLDPFLSLDELLREVLLSYGVASREAFSSGRLATATRHELSRTLHDFLLSLVSINGSAVLMIDEAQRLSPEVLEEIRILSNLETNDRKLLLIVLVGQLDLLEILRHPSLRQLDQRISIRCVLKPLERAGVNAYIEHRLSVARAARPVTFTPEAVDSIFEHSAGVPRVVNLIADRALMGGAEAQTDQITLPLVRRAARALGLKARTLHSPPAAPRVEATVQSQPAEAQAPATAPTTAPAPSRVPRLVVAAALAVVAVAAGAYWFFVMRPLAAMESGELPAPRNLTPSSLAVPLVPSLPAPETLPSLPPPIEEGAFSVLVGAFDSVRDVEQTAKTLRERGLPVYAVSLRAADAVRRRVLVGRYATREEALKIRTDLATDFPEARIIYGWFERVP
jgi:general secretion pathway protein A